MKELLFHHGNPPDYPEHMDWYIKGCVKNINRVLAEINVSISDLFFSNNNSDSLSYKINSCGLIKNREVKYNEYSSYIEVLKILVYEINKSIKSDQIILEKPVSDNESYNNANLFIKLLSGTNIRELEDFSLENKTSVYPADFYLPIESQSNLIKIFTKINDLNPKNSLNFEVLGQTSETFVIKCKSNDKEKEFTFDIRDFDKIGSMLNYFLKSDESKYVLIEPDEDTLVYAFCSKKDITLLSKHQLIRN